MNKTLFSLLAIFTLSMMNFVGCTHFGQNRQLLPSPPEATRLIQAAKVDLQKADWGSAEKKLTMVISNYRNFEAGDEALFLLARTYSRQSMWKKAFNVYESVYSSDVSSPRQGLARLAAAKILNQKINLPRRAVDLVNQSMGTRLRPSTRASLLEVKYDALLKSGAQLEAFEALVTLSQKHPDLKKRENFHNKAQSFVETRLSGPELKDYADEARSSSMKTQVSLRYGILMMEEGRFDEAKSYLSKVAREAAGTPTGEQALRALGQMTDSGKVHPRTIGVILPLSGKGGSVGYQVLNGIKLALGVHSSANSSEAYRLAIIDSEGDATKARAGVRKLANEDNCIAIIGGLFGSTAYAAAVQSQELGVPFVALSRKEGLTDLGPFVFRNALTLRSQVEALVDTARNSLDIKRFAILYPNDDYGVRLSSLFWEVVKEKGGEITAAQTYTPGEVDFKEPVKKLVGTFYVEDRKDEYNKRMREFKNSGKLGSRDRIPVGLLPPIIDFEALFVPDTPKAIGQIAPMLAYNDVKNIYLMGTDIWNSGEFVRRGKHFSGRSLFTDITFSGDKNFKNSAFFRRYTKIFEKQPSTFSLQGYDSAVIIRSAVEGGAQSRASFAREIKRHTGVNGAIGQLILNEKKEFQRPLVPLTVRGGEIVPFSRQ